MTQDQKRQVREALLRYTDQQTNQNEAAKQLRGISSATLSLVRSSNWQAVSDSMWQLIARQVGFYGGDWHAADTSAHLLLRILMGDAQRHHVGHYVCMPSGLGKTYTASWYMRQHDEVYYIAGNSGLNRRGIIAQLMQQTGQEEHALTKVMLLQLSAYFAERENTLLVVDDAHLLPDRALTVISRIAAAMGTHAGLLIMGNTMLHNRIVEGARLGIAGFETLYGLCRKKAVVLQQLQANDVELVCCANGITDAGVIQYITASCGSNLHHAACLITQYTRQKIAA